jgi:hypothetical protein
MPLPPTGGTPDALAALRQAAAVHMALTTAELDKLAAEVPRLLRPGTV